MKRQHIGLALSTILFFAAVPLLQATATPQSSTATPAPQAGSAPSPGSSAEGGSGSQPGADLAPVNTLVLIQLAGGNDGLNTVIPYADLAYAAARPTLAVPPAQVLRLSDTLGLHPSLAPLMDSWKAGDFAIALGVGYPNPNRSHFRSTDIWETGSASDQVLDTGWLERLLNATGRPQGIVADSLILGETSEGPLRGRGMHNLSMDALDSFLRDAAQLEPIPAGTSGSFSFINAVESDIVKAAAVLSALKPRIKEPTAAAFPDTPLGRQMKLAFQLLAAGLRVPVIKLTLRGFDSHSDEKPQYNRLLSELAGALSAFRTNLLSAGLWDNVLVMTYSEFGRRVAENGSQGTDHGTAAPVFFWGGRVKGGFYGTQPSLSDLDQGDLKFRLDFRVLYRTVAKEFWGIDDETVLDKVLPGVSATLPLIRPDLDKAVEASPTNAERLQVSATPRPSPTLPATRM